jgi:hypothetical protein
MDQVHVHHICSIYFLLHYRFIVWIHTPVVLCFMIITVLTTWSCTSRITMYLCTACNYMSIYPCFICKSFGPIWTCVAHLFLLLSLFVLNANYDYRAETIAAHGQAIFNKQLQMISSLSLGVRSSRSEVFWTVSTSRVKSENKAFWEHSLTSSFGGSQ